MKKIALRFSFLFVVFMLAFSACSGKQSSSKKSGKNEPIAKKDEKNEEKKKPVISKVEKIGDFTFNTGDYFSDVLAEAKINKAPEATNLTSGDPEQGKKIFLQVKKKKNKPSAGNCAACHCAKDISGCGNIGPKFDAAMVAKWKKDGDDWLYTQIADARSHNKDSVMSPTLPTKVLSPKDITDVMAFLKSLQ